MSLSNVLKYKIQSRPSLFVKILVLTLFVVSAILMFLLWGVDWFSFLFLIVYVVAFSSLVYLLKLPLFQCEVSEDGYIEINQLGRFIGQVSTRSFYNAWFIFLCVEMEDKFLIKGTKKHNTPKKWFVVFYDGIPEKDYRLLARLINRKHTA
ncbi:hypothetical protein E2R68_13585 [Psychromonas sp. RZ22]|uniref:protein YgfX n=1 Tax=Psychromonas algarum TaxID=2555643 RepID=UPI00106821D1|nr:protein YgfX [Psychromonas sp. RZ22]TEW53145.1 hypothetical protein E2R68_13585 [Psychromonas sp. RZ22]